MPSPPIPSSYGSTSTSPTRSNRPTPPSFRQRRSASRLSSSNLFPPSVSVPVPVVGSTNINTMSSGSASTSTSTSSSPITSDGGEITSRSFESFSTRPPVTPTSSTPNGVSPFPPPVESPPDGSPLDDAQYHQQPLLFHKQNIDHHLHESPTAPLILKHHLQQQHHLRPVRETHSRRNSAESDYSLAEEGEATPLLRSVTGESGVIEAQGEWYEGPLLVAGVKLALLFIAFVAVVAGTFYYGMPPVDPEDRPILKLPKSFSDLQALNGLFQKYKRQYPMSLLSCGVVSYLFVQTFSLPGSMYISILFGAAYGMLWGLLLSCLCESVGSVFCYAVSAILAPPLLTIPFYRARVEAWRSKIMGDQSSDSDSHSHSRTSWIDIGAFLLVLRITPFPPHWVCNVVAPHLGIGVFLFWITCFIGIAPVSVIHVTIGSSLDSMTSAADFHVLSLRNVLGLGAVVVAVMIPVGLKRVFKKDLGDLGVEQVEVQVEEVQVEGEEYVDEVYTVQGARYGGQERARYQAVDSGVMLAGPSAGEDEDEDGSDEDGDEAGQAETGVDARNIGGKGVKENNFGTKAFDGKGKVGGKVKAKGKGKGMGKGKSRMLDIIPDLGEEEEEEQEVVEVVEVEGKEEAESVPHKFKAKSSRGNDKRQASEKGKSYGAIGTGMAQSTVIV